jgi:hypothetical protein
VISGFSCGVNDVSSLFWNVTRRRLVFSHRRFRKIYRSHLQGSSSPRRILGLLAKFEFAVLACFCICLPNDDLVEFETCRRNISEKLLFIVESAICWITYCVVSLIGVTWLVSLRGGGGQNRPWVLGTLIYGVKLERNKYWSGIYPPYTPLARNMITLNSPKTFHTHHVIYSLYCHTPFNASLSLSSYAGSSFYLTYKHIVCHCMSASLGPLSYPPIRAFSGRAYHVCSRRSSQ